LLASALEPFLSEKSEEKKKQRSTAHPLARTRNKKKRTKLINEAAQKRIEKQRKKKQNKMSFM
jgi:hypothetical protein